MPALPHSPALVIGGMHRSGTSLLASLVHGAGMPMGQRLLAAGNGNVAGHYEDLDFVELHERILVGNGLGSEGFTADRLPTIPDRARHEALALVAARRGLGTPWGWKDPRTVLLLDDWAEMVPEARFILVFRAPWEVADSLFRRGDPAFFHNPPLALSVWQHYNRNLVGFAARHPDRCLVRELPQVIAGPGDLFDAIRRQFGIPLGAPPADRFHDGLLHTSADGARARLVKTSCPEAWTTYLELRRWAGTTTPLPDAVPIEVDRVAVFEWARAAAADRREADAVAHAATLEARLAEALRERDASREAGKRLEAQCAALSTACTAHAAECGAAAATLAEAHATAAALRARLASWQATAADIQAALATIDRFRGDTDLAGRFAHQWPDTAQPTAA